MTGKAIRRYHMLVRVSRFGAEHAASFPSGTLAQRSFAAVAEAAHELEQHAVTQASARSGGQAHTSARLARSECATVAAGAAAGSARSYSPGL